MQTASAYCLVVLIWSTTPLAIKLSNSSLTFVSAITLRLLLALVICYALLWVLRRPLVARPADWKVFIASGLGLFPNMLLVYWAAQHIPSGLMSVIMGSHPFFVGLVSWLALKENPFTAARALALLCALAGLAVIQWGQMQLGAEAALGVLVMLLVCVIWAVSVVAVKKYGVDVDPLRQGTGSLLVAVPFLLLSWYFLDGQIPAQVDQASLMGVGYLVLAGSVVGHTLYFYVLRNYSVSTVSMITLITPIMAIGWGRLFADEALSLQSILGALLILLALGIYQGIFRQLLNWAGRRRIAPVKQKSLAAPEQP